MVLPALNQLVADHVERLWPERRPKMQPKVALRRLQTSGATPRVGAPSPPPLIGPFVERDPTTLRVDPRTVIPLRTELIQVAGRLLVIVKGLATLATVVQAPPDLAPAGGGLADACGCHRWSSQGAAEQTCGWVRTGSQRFLGGGGAAEVEWSAGGGAVAGAGTADRAGGHGPVEPPTGGVGATGVRDIRDIRVSAGGPCRGGDLACRDIRDNTRLGRGCRGYRLTIRDRPAAHLTSSFARRSRMSRMSRQIARPGLVQVGAGVALALGTGAVLADVLRPSTVGP